MDYESLNFIQSNSPDGGFLQSKHWRNFQKSVGREAFTISAKDDDELMMHASIIVHSLPVAGNYFYTPRGPVIETFNFQFSIFKQLQKFLDDLIRLADKENIGWIRIEPTNEETLDLIKGDLPDGIKIKKSAVDMQPREILVLDISKSEEEILARMKQKTRYNIKLSQKRSVRVSHNMEHGTWNKRFIEEFLRLVKITAKRDRLIPHPESYYRKMFEVIPPEILKLYVAEYQGKIIAANLVLFFGKTATYMHGASDNVHRDTMASYLLQWQAMKDAKKAGCTRYDLGGVKMSHDMGHGTWDNGWSGITKFKTGFAPETKPVQFPGCYDIILRPGKYNLYRTLQKIKKYFRNG